MNNRRKLMLLLGAGARTATFRSFAQQQDKVWRVGLLSPRARPALFTSDVFGAFLGKMRELGYVEGKNLLIDGGLPVATTRTSPAWQRSSRA